MGRTPQERAEALRRYIRQDVMRNYAEGFGKGLRSDDVEYYAKIHFNRDGDSDNDMHAHIIVSRKDRSNTKKLSPKTNHTGKKNCGNMKGGFDRTDFFRKCESSFDRRMGVDREPEESFDYLNAVKNGSPAEIVRQESEKSKIQHVEKTPDIERPTPKKQPEEDLELRQKPKKSRGFGMDFAQPLYATNILLVRSLSCLRSTVRVRFELLLLRKRLVALIENPVHLRC